jgi:hypothetical protein
MTTYIKSHRCVGKLVAQIDEYLIVETAPGPGKVLALKAITTQPGTEADVLMQLRIELFDAIAKAKFLGLDMTAISSLIADELSRYETSNP